MKENLLLLNLFFAAGISFVHADLSCITCSSNDISLCATDPVQLKLKKCSEAHPKCFTRIESDGQTIRGCVENTPEELNKIGCNGTENETCELCKEDFDGCNIELFPSHRDNCLQCEGDFDGKCFTDADAKGNPCPLYVLGDKCIIWKSETEKKIKRGCLSDESSGLCKDNSKCYICGGHSCNFLLGNNPLIPKNSASNLSGISVLAFTATFFAIYRI